MKDGIILIDKPQGITSFTAVAILKRRLGVKCGHSGTLDPLATGLLPIMCGKATKLCSYLTEGDKRYIAKMKFGIATDSYDITGNITETDNSIITKEQILEVLPEFTGVIKQIPPAYSAIKVGGTALYKLAREGKEVKVPEREITIYSIEVTDFDNGELEMDVRCSKGTYIRSLCHDIAKRLGTVGVMSALRRVETGGWSVEDAISPDFEQLEERIIPLEQALERYPKFNPGKFFGGLLSNGCAIDMVKLKNVPEGICRVYCEDTLLGLGSRMEKDGKEHFKIITHLKAD